jgi:hypothetical protein
MYVDASMWILFGNALCLFKLFMSIVRNCHVVSDDNDDALWCLVLAKRPSKNEALEAVDFIINVLREHEKDLDRLISELGKVTSKFSQGGEVPNKITRVEERLAQLQSEVSGLIKELSSPKEVGGYVHRGPPVIVRCKQWDDFRVLAKEAETVSFLFKEAEKSFQADALKEGRVLTYNGEFPRDSKLLKFWLARELNVTEDKVFEGVLAIG